MEALLGSQQKLSASIERLVTGAYLTCARTLLNPRRAELDTLAANTPDGAAATQAAKLVALRKRVGALSAALHSIQERLNRLHLAVGRLPTATLADLARQELHAPPPPAPEALKARAGPLANAAALGGASSPAG